MTYVKFLGQCLIHTKQLINMIFCPSSKQSSELCGPNIVNIILYIRPASHYCTIALEYAVAPQVTVMRKSPQLLQINACEKKKIKFLFLRRHYSFPVSAPLHSRFATQSS